MTEDEKIPSPMTEFELAEARYIAEDLDEVDRHAVAARWFRRLLGEVEQLTAECRHHRERGRRDSEEALRGVFDDAPSRKPGLRPASEVLAEFDKARERDKREAEKQTAPPQPAGMPATEFDQESGFVPAIHSLQAAYTADVQRAWAMGASMSPAAQMLEARDKRDAEIRAETWEACERIVREVQEIANWDWNHASPPHWRIACDEILARLAEERKRGERKEETTP